MNKETIPSNTFSDLKYKYVYRTPAIEAICEDKSVLNLGCLCHSNWEQQIQNRTWLHGNLCNVASSIVGIDYLTEDIGRLQTKYGYEVLLGDVMNLDNVNTDKTFDVIVCGELIEHIENPGLMLSGIKRFCHSKSIVVFTTPNPWWLRRCNLFFAQREQYKLNPEHVMYYSYWTLKALMERMGYQETIYGYYGAELEPYQASKLRQLFSKALIHITPQSMQRGLFFVATPTLNNTQDDG
ncbi:methyltransferase domain-containing protein [Halospina sp. K52047b]|uniref:class I SAM-dependent methyltransferase n=1 Tax=Halospina sp. K52047b TaxID=2614160 RepID=UPI001249DEF2|nr:methyltransferase domain-containing protein [Halospina sp. K52047b]KAA8981916.1 methyltransferase domain-containing protein [Halospina sp. K52047b]